MKHWDSIRKQTEYYMEKYGHLFHPPREFNDLVNMFKKVGEINPEDAFSYLDTFELIEDYPNKFICRCKPRNEEALMSTIIIDKCGGKYLREKSDSRYMAWVLPKVIAPKEKIEISKVPEVREEKEEININDIFIPPDYVRKYVDPNYINEIAKSIKEVGQVDPIIVVPINYVKDVEKKYGEEAKKYKYILIRGLHRIYAFKLLNNFYIKAIVKYNDYEEERLKSLNEQVARKLSPIEFAIEIDRYLKMGYKEEEIAKKFACSRQKISRHKKYVIFAKNFKEYIDVFTAYTRRALDYLCYLQLHPAYLDGYILKKSIEAFKSGKREINEGMLGKWVLEYNKMKEEEEKEKERKRLEKLGIRPIKEETIQASPTFSTQSKTTQVQIEKPRPIQTKETAREVRRRKEKKPEEKFDHKFLKYSYAYPNEVVSIIKKVLNEIPMEKKVKLNMLEVFRNCGKILYDVIKTELSEKEIEKLFRESIKQILERL